MSTAAAQPQKRPLLSITVPCHKQDPLLDRALESCLKLAEHAEIEVVVSWNSTDRAAFEQIRARFPAFRWYQPPQPLSMGANWDYCLQQALGEWCLVLSYDDQLLPDRVLAMLPTLTACGPEVGCYFGLAAVEDAVLSPPKLTYPTAQYKRLWRPQELWMQVPWGTPVHLPAAFFRRTAWERSGGFDNGLAFACDAGVWERIARQFAIWSTSDCWCIYRWHAYSIAAAQAAREDVIKLAADYLKQLAPWDFVGRLVCRFGYARQERLAIEMNSDYRINELAKLSFQKRVAWTIWCWLDRIEIGRHLLSRFIFRILVFLWRLSLKVAGLVIPQPGNQ
jgi:glycosyltransferase involved in cell wall biosynthesis